MNHHNDETYNAASTMEYLENERNKIIQTVTGVDHGIAEGMDLTHALDHTIALIWPMRKRRIMHDMVELHFNKMCHSFSSPYKSSCFFKHSITWDAIGTTCLALIVRFCQPTSLSVPVCSFTFVASYTRVLHSSQKEET